MESVQTQASVFMPEINAPQPMVSSPPQADKAENPALPRPELSDRLLLDLAKARLEKKHGLIWQCVDAVLLAASLILLWALQDFYDRSVFGFLVFFLYMGRLSYRVLRFLKPSLKNGVKEFFRKRKEESIRREYDLLRKLTEEQQ